MKLKELRRKRILQTAERTTKRKSNFIFSSKSYKVKSGHLLAFALEPAISIRIIDHLLIATVWLSRFLDMMSMI